MKKLFILSIFLTIPLLVFGQKDSVNIWISRIDNSSIEGTCQYSWVIIPKQNKPEINKLIKTGKSIKHKLTKLLTDENKGIIAHYILSNIYGEFSYRILSMDSVQITYNYNGLEFKEMVEKIATDQSNLRKIKEYWIKKK
ncbi:MAG: hypothetical protein V4714_14230 [Bacteroidota bacterium]